MKARFPGYFRPTEEEFRELWRDALVIPDANVLLNLVRYDAVSRDFSLLQDMHDGTFGMLARSFSKKAMRAIT